tara:strand:+ start:6078 stop:6725 length:648 start_codon:yes stop_codon:yes gene_type:complete
MCFSLESSRNSFLTGGISSIYLLFFSENDTNKHAGLFFFIVCLIQLLEYFMWKDQNCGLMNDLASRSVQSILTLQILSIFVGAYIFNTTTLPKDILIYLICSISIYLFHVSYISYINNKLKWCTKPNKDNSLQWANHKELFLQENYATFLYMLTYISIPFFLNEKWKGIFILTAGAISYYITKRKYDNSGTINSRWCYYSALIPPLFIIFDKLKF